MTWEVTRFCNLFCDHCCTLSGPDAVRAQEPPLAALVAAARDLGPLGVTKVQFSGGEPLLRDGFLDVLDAVDTGRVKVHLASNGYRLTDDVVGRLVDAGLHKLSVSIDGGDAALHDSLRRRSGAFVRTVEGVTRALRAGLRVGISVTVTPGNVFSLESLLSRLVEMGVADVSFHSVVAVGRAVEHPELLFPESASERLEAEIVRLKERYGDAVPIDHSFGGADSVVGPGCPAQQRLLHIDPNGDVSPCSWLYKLDPAGFTLGNIVDEPLSSIVERRCDRLEELRAVERDRCVIPLVPKATC